MHKDRHTSEHTSAVMFSALQRSLTLLCGALLLKSEKKEVPPFPPAPRFLLDFEPFW